MPTFLWRASYTAEGAKGLVKDGGSKRRDVVQQMVTKAGGKLHAFYFAMVTRTSTASPSFPTSPRRWGSASRSTPVGP